jgi:hypothetical protein
MLPWGKKKGEASGPAIGLIISLVGGLVTIVVILSVIFIVRDGQLNDESMRETGCWVSNTMKCGGGGFAFFASWCRQDTLEDVDGEKFAELLRDTKWMFKEGECDFGNAHDEFYPVYAFIPNEDGIALDEYLRDSTKNNKGRTSTFAKSDYNYIESNTEGQGICFDLEDSGIQNNILTPGETYYIQYFDDQPAHTIGDKILVSSDPNFDNDHLWNILNSFFSEGGSDGGCLAYGSSEAILA